MGREEEEEGRERVEAMALCISAVLGAGPGPLWGWEGGSGAGVLCKGDWVVTFEVMVPVVVGGVGGRSCGNSRV